LRAVGEPHRQAGLAVGLDQDAIVAGWPDEVGRALLVAAARQADGQREGGERRGREGRPAGRRSRRAARPRRFDGGR
jgi:hypothetical protein